VVHWCHHVHAAGGHASVPNFGRAVQVDPMKPKLTPPGTKRMKLKCGYAAFNVCFHIQLAPLHLGRACDVQAHPRQRVRVPGAARREQERTRPNPLGAGAEAVRPPLDCRPSGRGLHTSTFRLNLPTSSCLIDRGESLHPTYPKPQYVLTLSRKVDECQPLPGGSPAAARGVPGVGHAGAQDRHGRAVHVDPIKPN